MPPCRVAMPRADGGAQPSASDPGGARVIEPVQVDESFTVVSARPDMSTSDDD